MEPIRGIYKGIHQIYMGINEIYKSKGVKRPEYQGEVPEGNDGLGLMLLGITGDQVLR